uniref:Uncharacterized protein n=1 Tax=Lepeophtheirus salmonis TaxID=72036 RepID=A0A0K2V9A3_LEPSM
MSFSCRSKLASSSP